MDTQSLFSTAQANGGDLQEVKGQETVKRLGDCRAGGHNLILIGPPGTGKSMLAKRLGGILPPLTLNEALETTRIHSVAGLLEPHQALVTGNGRFGLPTTRPVMLGCWAATLTLRQVRFRCRIMAFCFWMNCPSFDAAFWKPCANRSRKGT